MVAWCVLSSDVNAQSLFDSPHYDRQEEKWFDSRNAHASVLPALAKDPHFYGTV